jgi:hypothetical protein
MIRGIQALAKDPGTHVIALISKPADRDIAKRVLEVASRSGKPVIVNFLGDAGSPDNHQNISHASTLEETAYFAVAKSKGIDIAAEKLGRHNQNSERIGELSAMLGKGQTYVRGLYSGGTFAYEAMLILEPDLGTVQSASPLSAAGKLDDAWVSRGHTVVDLGDDVFTRGRPHPMIDHRLRNERIVQEAEDPETAVILLDVVLGYGAHENPASAMAEAISVARDRAGRAGQTIQFVGFVCGTSGDPQNLSRQEQVLADAGVILTENNAQAARLAMDIVIANNESKIDRPRETAI